MSESQLPDQFEEFTKARKEGFLKAMAIKEAGGHIAGTFCTFTPCELMDAAGIHPVSLCGMSPEPIPAAERDLPKNLCPLIKSSYGFAVSDTCPYTYFSDLIVGETTCDGKKKMYELLGKLKDVYILQLPQGIDRDYALELWTKELYRFRTVLEEKFHVTITDAALREAAVLRNQLRQARTALMELQKLDPPPFTGLGLYQLLDGLGFSFDLQANLKKLTDLTRQLLEDYNAGARPVPAGQKRILVTGCPIGGVLEKTVKVVEENGGVVVCFENCGGIKPTRYLVDTQADDIMTAIAKRYLNIGCAVMTPNPQRMELLPQLVEEFRVDGILEIELQTCHPYTVERQQIKQLASEIGVPFLAVDTDYSQSDLGQLTTRIAAFIEML
ncbi:MAG: 2-hydroxyacyl-CoA dehydratase [Oscillospiraceae bacterium]|nr:2-hydroxyacyl-CoA dehydratase [Oscillospiraceae bacterium]